MLVVVVVELLCLLLLLFTVHHNILAIIYHRTSDHRHKVYYRDGEIRWEDMNSCRSQFIDVTRHREVGSLISRCGVVVESLLMLLLLL